MAFKDEQLIRFAMEMKGEAPAAWHNFVTAVRVLAAQAAGQMVVTPAENLAKAQGYALALHEMADTFQKLQELHDKMLAQHMSKVRNTK